MDALKQQVRSEAKEFKKSAGEALEAHDVEREIRHERIRAEAAHLAEQHQLKKDVEAEAKTLFETGEPSICMRSRKSFT
jgi:cytidylate kinase